MNKTTFYNLIVIIILVLVILFGVVFGSKLFSKVDKTNKVLIITYLNAEEATVTQLKLLNSTESYYAFNVNNAYLGRVTYSLKFINLNDADISDKVLFKLYNNDKAVKANYLTKIKNNVIYSKILKKGEQDNYKFYVGVDDENIVIQNFKYKIVIEVKG